MSIETRTRIICDGCSVFIEGQPSSLATRLSKSYWDAKRSAKDARWLLQERPYRRDVHYCPACADKPQTPIAPPERKKKCQACRDATKAEKLDNSYKVNMGYHRCEVCGWKRIRWVHK